MIFFSDCGFFFVHNIFQKNFFGNNIFRFGLGLINALGYSTFHYSSSLNGFQNIFLPFKKEIWFDFIFLFEVYFLVCAFHKDALFSLNVILAITYIFQKYTENTLGNVLECTGFIYLFIIHCLFYLLLLSIFFFFFFE